jgi:hypothetical protein
VLDEADHRMRREVHFHIKDMQDPAPRRASAELADALTATHSVALSALLRAAMTLEMRVGAGAGGLPSASAHEAPFFEALLQRNCSGSGSEVAAAASSGVPPPADADAAAELRARRAAYILTIDLGVCTLQAWRAVAFVLGGSSKDEQAATLRAVVAAKVPAFALLLPLVLRVVAANARARTPSTAAASSWLAALFDQWQEELPECVADMAHGSPAVAEIQAALAADGGAALAADGGAALAALRAAGEAYDATVARFMATLPSLPPPVAKRHCSAAACNEPEEHAGQFKTCARCRRAWYCSAACQRAHWKEGHKRECRVPATS